MGPGYTLSRSSGAPLSHSKGVLPCSRVLLNTTVRVDFPPGGTKIETETTQGNTESKGPTFTVPWVSP